VKIVHGVHLAQQRLVIRRTSVLELQHRKLENSIHEGVKDAVDA
jgi:hypothetical protein